MKLIEDLKWRYAVKKFDVSKKVTEEQLKEVLEAGNLAATSFGMQAYRFVVVKDKDLIAQLAEHSWGEQLKGASHVIVLAACTNVDGDFVKSYIDYTAEVRKTEPEKLEMRENIILGYLKTLESENRKEDWAARQTYIVLGTMMAACANARIDCCPMEGIQKAKYDEILGLASKNLTTVVSLPIGVRAEDDHHQGLPKVRRSLEEMIIEC